MGATTKWEPVKARGKNLNVVSSFLDVVAEATDQEGAQEVFLWRGHIPTLRGIAAADKATRESITTLISALEQFDSIRLWREY